MVSLGDVLGSVFYVLCGDGQNINLILLILIAFASNYYIYSTYMSNPVSEGRNNIKELNELFRLDRQIAKKEKTVILYDLFQNKEENQVQLNNLHVCAQVMVNPALEVTDEIEEDQNGIPTHRYQIVEKQGSPNKIIRTPFVVEVVEEGKQPSFDNIWIYDQEQGDLRVVVIPIQKDMINIDMIRREAENDKEEDIKMKQDFKNRGLQHLELQTAVKQWQQIKQERFEKRCVIARQKHTKMFRIEALLGTVLQKTEKVSICCFVEIGDRRYKEIKDFISQFPTLFSVPENFKPQLAVHKWTAKNKKLDEKCQREDVTTIFSMGQGKLGVKKFELLNDKYFYSNENVRTKIYENMERNDNEAIKFVIHEFVSNFNSIAVKTALTFGSVVKRVNSLMFEEMKGQEPLSNDDSVNISFDASSYKDIPQAETFKDIFEKYISPDLWLARDEDIKIGKYYTDDRLKNIKVQKGYPSIPEKIENLVFIHYLYKIGREFLEKFSKKDIEVKGNQLELLELWKEGLRDVYSLVNEVNVTILRKQENEDLSCPDMDKFFSFLLFTIESLVKIKKITKRAIPTATELRSNFEALQFKKEAILCYIIANQRNIKKNQPVHYYDLLLRIISENASKDVVKDMASIFLHIHELKAYLIANDYIYDVEKVIQAIKSYALIVIAYGNISPNKRELIDIVTIYKRLARLLKVVSLEEQAAQIYTKLREMDNVDKCYSVILTKSSGNADQKAKKLLEWGKVFESEFEYDLALKYYRKAFGYAREIKIKQEALKIKIDCNEKIRTGPTEEEIRMHQNFLNDGDYLTYISKENIESLLRDLRQRLRWDYKTGAYFSSGEKENNDQDNSFLLELEGNLDQLEKSSKTEN